jgi:hypothetical protein
VGEDADDRRTGGAQPAVEFQAEDGRGELRPAVDPVGAVVARRHQVVDVDGLRFGAKPSR